MKRNDPAEAPMKGLAFMKQHHEKISAVAEALENAGRRLADVVLFLGDPSADSYAAQVRRLYGSYDREARATRAKAKEGEPMCSYFPRSFLRERLAVLGVKEAAALDHPPPPVPSRIAHGHS